MPNEPSPDRPSRVQRVVAGELDAIFKEGVVVWANQAIDAGMRFLDIDEGHLRSLKDKGFRRGTMQRERFEKLDGDVATVDFSGWPIYTRIDAPDLLVRKFCEAMAARRGSIPWTFGPIQQSEMPLARMVVEGTGVPIDMPFHPVAREFWVERGYLGD